MLKNRPIAKDENYYPGIDFKETPAPLSINASSISKTIRSKIPSGKIKYDRHEKIDRLYLEWTQSPQKQVNGRYETILFFFYELYKPRIMSIIKKYRTLSPVIDEDDLQQTALLGILQALIKYDHAPHIKMKFSTFLEWSIRNVFQRTVGYADKFVEIYNRDNELLYTTSYQDFLPEKKSVESAGHTYIVRSRQCYLSDMSVASGTGTGGTVFDEETTGPEHTGDI